jgi:peptide/nickel transport system substrate-binding protein
VRNYRLRPILLLLCLCLPPVLAGCSGGPDTLRIAVTQWARNLDPLSTPEQGSWIIAATVYEALFDVDASGQLVGRLAHTWEYDPTYTRFTVVLRGDVRFHDGTLLSAETAALSLRRAVGLEPTPDIAALVNARARLFGSPDAIEVKNDSTLVIQLPAPHMPLARSLSSPFLAPIIGLPQDSPSLESIGSGTGPYRISRASPENDLMVLDRFDGYWGTRPIADRLEFQAFQSAEEGARAIMAGNVDLLLSVSIGDTRAIVLNESVHLVTGSEASYLVFGLNNQRSPFNRVENRRALVMSIDRDAFIAALYGDTATPTRAFIGRLYNPSVPSPLAPAFDRTRAEQFLREHFPKDQKSVRFLIPPQYTPERRGWTVAGLDEQLRHVGIGIEPVYAERWDDFYRLLDEGDWDISVDGFATESGDLYEALFTLYAEPNARGGNGIFAMSGEGVADLLEKARSEPDRDTRLSYFSEALDLIAMAVPCVPLCNRSVIAARSADVEPFEVTRNLQFNLERIRKSSWR